MEALLGSNADPQIKDTSGMTALDHAVAGKHVETASVLRAYAMKAASS
jgi:hypothetical protein